MHPVRIAKDEALEAALAVEVERSGGFQEFHPGFDAQLLDPAVEPRVPPGPGLVATADGGAHAAEKLVGHVVEAVGHGQGVVVADQPGSGFEQRFGEPLLLGRKYGLPDGVFQTFCLARVKLVAIGG